MASEGCRCGIPDWSRLRKALGLYQAEFGRLINYSVQAVKRIERRPHECPSPRCVLALRRALIEPRLLAMLRENGCPYPYLSDVGTPMFWANDVGPRCEVCDIPLLMHDRCVMCTNLAGPEHTIKELGKDKLCLSCKRNIVVTLQQRQANKPRQYAS